MNTRVLSVARKIAKVDRTLAKEFLVAAKNFTWKDWDLYEPKTKKQEEKLKNAEEDLKLAMKTLESNIGRMTNFKKFESEHVDEFVEFLFDEYLGNVTKQYSKLGANDTASRARVYEIIRKLVKNYFK